MNWDFWVTLTVLVVVIVGLVRYAHLSDVIFLGATSLLACAGVITPAEALAGFHNEGVVTVGALFVVAAALVETGLLESAASRLLGRTTEAAGALRRIVPATAFASAFLNNTTIVAMGIPALTDWAKKRAVPVSRLLLPLSFAALLGGVCTLIGTSTNLIVHGLMKQSGVRSLAEGLGMWELARVGVPIAILGGAYLVITAPRLLAGRNQFRERVGASLREFLCEVVVDPHCPLVGRTVQEAGLRGLPGLFLIEIERGDVSIAPVRPEDRLQASDRLVFTGVVETIVDLKRIPGLRPSADLMYSIESGKRPGRRFSEAVISVSSPLVGRSVREANFRSLYDAVVVAIHRNGQRVKSKVGDIHLQPGDTLLLETGTAFAASHRNSQDFYLVSDAGDVSPRTVQRARVAAVVAAAFVVVLSLPEFLRWIPSLSIVAEWAEKHRAVFAILAAGLMVLTRCLSPGQARRAVEWHVLLAIASALGVGTAMTKSGLAGWLSNATVELAQPWGPTGVLMVIFLLTWLLTELMSNNAAAILMFPIAVAASESIGAEPRPFVVAVVMAASCSFVLPVGYQTHLMVLGPGGYQTADFLKLGGPMVALWFLVSMVLIPFGWPLTPG